MNKERILGQHLTSTSIFKRFILPKIKDKLKDYAWVDLYCGEGNLILPILETIKTEERENFFSEHIFLFDSDSEMIEKAVQNAIKLGISEELARKNIKQHDSLASFPKIESKFPIFHITNPPYLYIGYIQKNAKQHLKYFQDKNKGYQDLYQIALINDLKNNIEKSVYIIPSNFLFSSSGTNKIRRDFLQAYKITNAVIFEKKIFENTGTNVAIFWFEKKQESKKPIKFTALKITENEEKRREYSLTYENNYRAGSEFSEFCNNQNNNLRVNYYLMQSEVEKNSGNTEIEVINSNKYKNNKYSKEVIRVNEKLAAKIKNNILFIRTVDSGSNLRAGLYEIKDEFKVDGILVSIPYRTNPIQLFFTPELSIEQQIKLKDYFNSKLEELREKTDSEFMTTYKYSKAKYTRKYLGLSQVKKLIQTFSLD
ncbi:MAG: N-6 DNA methylase [Nanoarchaeota archaeon]|nr:N-6 DNA methylase [Nanoarchaeota archaeon]